jgi:hypothetical protein
MGRYQFFQVLAVAEATGRGILSPQQDDFTDFVAVFTMVFKNRHGISFHRQGRLVASFSKDLYPVEYFNSKAHARSLK